MPKVAFTTLGCKVNQYESQALAGLFKAQGYDLVDFSQKADVYIINTCSVTNLSERKSRQMIRRTNGKNPEAVVAVIGCYAQASAEKVARMPGVDIIAGTKDRKQIIDLVEDMREKKLKSKINLVSDAKNNLHFEEMSLLFAPERTRAFLKIQDGCENYCTYCIIPYLRGPLRSRGMASILTEAEKLIADGFKEIVFTGIHLGAYGRDLPGGESLAGAAAAVLKLKGLARLRLGSLEGVEVSDELIELMQEDQRLCPHLHLPLQSGDDDILKAMHRHYTTTYYQNVVEKIRKKIPNIAVTTDIIAGFPGEDEGKFNNTANFIRAMNFAKVHVFPYSKRSGTLAAGYKDQVAEREKKRRVQILQQLSLEQTAFFQTSFIGRDMEVLFEGVEADGRSDENALKNGVDGENSIIEGLTGNYMRVYAGGNFDSIGKLRKVKVQKFCSGKLWGEILK